jgi:hypothetical protein
MRVYDHPHPDPAHVMRSYRAYLIGQKRIWMSQKRTAKRCLRGLTHYKEYIHTYLAAKEIVCKQQSSATRS